ncbi:MAG TPA: hypothetical protein VGJ81_09815 [Thermoanaerobaculia bacterium]|jgi:hypothetical protein
MSGSRSDFSTMTFDEMEIAFIEDFVQFGAKINLSATLRLLAALPAEGIERKRLAAVILQQLYIALEDFAVLLSAMIKRKEGGRHLHFEMSFSEKTGDDLLSGNHEEATSGRELTDAVGFSNVTVEKLNRIGYEVAESDFDTSFADFGSSVKQLAQYVGDFNEVKNRLKHGKAVFGVVFDLAESDEVAHAEYDKNKNRLSLAITDTSQDQVEVAVVFIAKLAKMSLDLLTLFTTQYHDDDAAVRIAYLAKDQYEEMVASAKAVGLSSKGLTDYVAAS